MNILFKTKNNKLNTQPFSFFPTCKCIHMGIDFDWQIYYSHKWIAIGALCSTSSFAILEMILLLRAVYTFYLQPKIIQKQLKIELKLRRSLQLVKSRPTSIMSVPSPREGVGVRSVSGQTVETLGTQKLSVSTTSNQPNTLQISAPITINEKRQSKLEKQKQKAEKILNVYKLSKYSFLSCVFWSVIFAIFCIIFLILPMFFENRSISCGDRSLISMLYSFQRISLMFFFIVRLSCSFANSIYQINKTFISTFIVFTLVLYIGGSIGFINLSYQTQYGKNGFSCDENATLAPSGAMVSLDASFNIVLGLLFQFKLTQVSANFPQKASERRVKQTNQNKQCKDTTQHTTKTETRSRSGSASTSLQRVSSGLSNSQVLKIRALITKLLILLISNVIISLLCLLILFSNLSYTAACLDMMVSNICLWLSYNFNHDLYTKCCKPCIFCSHLLRSS